jgi:hypothetical protein
MRSALTLLVAIALPTLAAAQSTMRDGPPFSALGPIGLPLPSITSTLPPIGLPLPRLELPQINSSFKIRGLTPERRAQRPERPDHRGREPRRNSHTTFVYFVPSVYMDLFAPESMAPPVSASWAPQLPPPSYRPPTGWLQLELENAAPGAQVFVDRYFAGTLDEINSQLLLEPGSHEVEIRSPGSPPIGFDVRVVADRTITYRGAFEKADVVAPKPAESRATSRTIYFIPGCYLGNVLPQQSALPASCDIGRLSTYKQ